MRREFASVETSSQVTAMAVVPHVRVVEFIEADLLYDDKLHLLSGIDFKHNLVV